MEPLQYIGERRPPISGVPDDNEAGVSDSREGILFVDSTQVLTAGNDVAHLYLRVLSHVTKGVYVHAHDIRYPQEYPSEWLVDSHFFWSKQYLIHAFLAINSDFMWAGSHINERHGFSWERYLTDYSY